MLVLKLSKLMDGEVVCCVPLAHQERLPRDVRHQVKKQTWRPGQLQQHCAQSAHVLGQIFSFSNRKLDGYCGRQSVSNSMCVNNW